MILIVFLEGFRCLLILVLDCLVVKLLFCLVFGVVFVNNAFRYFLGFTICSFLDVSRVFVKLSFPCVCLCF